MATATPGIYTATIFFGAALALAADAATNALRATGAIPAVPFGAALVLVLIASALAAVSWLRVRRVPQARAECRTASEVFAGVFLPILVAAGLGLENWPTWAQVAFWGCYIAGVVAVERRATRMEWAQVNQDEEG